MFVQLVYDKRNVDGLVGAREIILAELTKRVHQIFPDAEVRVKPMQANGLNSDASKSDREKLNRMLEEMFEDANMWLVNDQQSPCSLRAYLQLRRHAPLPIVLFRY